jgi:hypothetical protein
MSGMLPGRHQRVVGRGVRLGAIPDGVLGRGGVLRAVAAAGASQTGGYRQGRTGNSRAGADDRTLTRRHHRRGPSATARSPMSWAQANVRNPLPRSTLVAPTQNPHQERRWLILGVIAVANPGSAAEPVAA